MDACKMLGHPYEALLQAADDGKIMINGYEEMGEKKLSLIRNAIFGEYERFRNHPEYISFLRANSVFFPVALILCAGKRAYEKN
jgi:hypothetical protein